MTKDEMVKGLRYKAANIKAHMEPQFFAEIVDYLEALDTAIQALEQEPILDKIKADIERRCCITVGREDDPAITLYDVFEIIDKYRTESEDKK